MSYILYQDCSRVATKLLPSHLLVLHRSFNCITSMTVVVIGSWFSIVLPVCTPVSCETPKETEKGKGKVAPISSLDHILPRCLPEWTACHLSFVSYSRDQPEKSIGVCLGVFGESVGSETALVQKTVGKVAN